MHVLVLAQYFKPESVGAAIWIHELAVDLVAKGHQVTMLTAFPNYPERTVFEGYRGKLLMRERIDGIQVIRCWIYASPNQSLWSRALNFGSFCSSAVFGGLLASGPDVVYSILPPLPLGLTASLVGLAKHAPVVVNIQDIYPDIAMALGILRNATAIRFFRWLEKAIYTRVAGIVVISAGFRENLLAKGVGPSKVHVVPNWADPAFIQPGPKHNSFRNELNLDNQFLLVYSGNLSHNSNVEPILHAADRLRGELFSFAIVGDGVHKPVLQRLAQEQGLDNLHFLPFQPLSRYPEVLLAADMNAVTLNSQAAVASVPSKIFKQMAAGRPILAITTFGNEVDRLIKEAECGLCVPPDDAAALVEALRWAEAHPKELAQMGTNGRRYLEQHHSRSRCVSQIEALLGEVANG
jgi:colanic acid biosynthesis glycosyl transferase WcaI